MSRQPDDPLRPTRNANTRDSPSMWTDDSRSELGGPENTKLTSEFAFALL